MSMRNSWVTPKEAGLLAGYTTRGIQKLITLGRLSATKEDGKWYIDKSELFRVFPQSQKEEQKRNFAANSAVGEKLEMQNNLLKEISSQKDKEIEFLRNQIEFISQEKIKMLDAIVSQTKFLEHRPEKTSQEKTTWKDIFKFKNKEDL